MKRTAMTFLAACIVSISFAQKENYQQGYIVKNYFDTTRGFIIHEPWEINPKQISFRDVDGTITKFTANDITGFKVENRLYETANVEVELSPEELQDLTYESEFKIEKRTAFIEALIPGEKGLYALVLNSGKPNFYIKYNAKLELLLYKSYLQSSGMNTGTSRSEKTITKNKKFIEQLALYLDECTLIHPKLKSLDYKQRQLEDIIIYYMNCVGRDEVPREKIRTRKIAPRLTVIAGMSMTSLRFKAKSKPFLTEAEFDKSINFTGGIGFEVFPKTERWSFVMEGLYVSYKTEGEYEKEAGSQYTLVTSTFNNHYVKLNMMPRLNISIKNTTLFFNAGISVGFALKLDAAQTEYRTLGNSEETIERMPYKNEKTYEIGIILGMGATYKRFTLQARHEGSNGFTVEPTLASRPSSFRFLLSYQFNKNKK